MEECANEKQTLFYGIDAALLHEQRPSLYMERVSLTPVFNQPPFHMLNQLKATPQPPKHHPEGNVWNHMLLVLDEAAKKREKSSNPRVFMWAALLHDIGKPGTTKIRQGKITSYNHDKLGEELSIAFLSAFTDDLAFIESVARLVRWHMQILFVAKDMVFADVNAMINQVDIEEVALLGLCDRLGRLGACKKVEEENIALFLRKARAK